MSSSPGSDDGKSSFAERPSPPLPRRGVRCECGAEALWVYQGGHFVGYQCYQHGFLSHDALITPATEGERWPTS